MINWIKKCTNKNVLGDYEIGVPRCRSYLTVSNKLAQKLGDYVIFAIDKERNELYLSKASKDVGFKLSYVYNSPNAKLQSGELLKILKNVVPGTYSVKLSNTTDYAYWICPIEVEK